MPPARFFLCVVVACAAIAFVGLGVVDQGGWDCLPYILAGAAAIPLGGMALGLALVFHFRRGHGRARLAHGAERPQRGRKVHHSF